MTLKVFERSALSQHCLQRVLRPQALPASEGRPVGDQNLTGSVFRVPGTEIMKSHGVKGRQRPSHALAKVQIGTSHFTCIWYYYYGADTTSIILRTSCYHPYTYTTSITCLVLLRRKGGRNPVPFFEAMRSAEARPTSCCSRFGCAGDIGV